MPACPLDPHPGDYLVVGDDEVPPALALVVSREADGTLGLRILPGRPDRHDEFRTRRPPDAHVGPQAISDHHINVFWIDEDAGYIADIPDLDGCSAFGESPEQAMAEVTLAKAAWKKRHGMRVERCRSLGTAPRSTPADPSRPET